MLKAIREKIATAIRGTCFEGKVYLVGGCVRDEMLGRPTQDIDLVVELPNGGILLAEYLYKLGLASKPVVYKQFGTALIQVGKHKIELVMTRRESYRSHSRKPEVAFGSLQEDVQRRDFTINSLLMNVSDGKFLDLSGRGLADLRAGIIGATSRPEVIFAEDPLRMLRAVRFSVELGFRIEAQTLAQLRRQSASMQFISRERIAGEFLRIIRHPEYLGGISLLIKTGLKRYILPGLKTSSLFSSSKFDLADRLGSTETRAALQRLSWQARIALLLYNTRNGTYYLNLLKLSAQDRRHILHLLNASRQVKQLVRNGMLQTDGQFLKAALRLDSCLADFTDYYPLTGVFYGRGKTKLEQDLEICRKIRESYEKLGSYRFNLTGDDLIRTFCTKGVKIGLWLVMAKEYWYEHPQAGKRELLQYIRTKIPTEIKKSKEK
jgi:tRNA nucleotidyltransferase/poly(A) polymerase